MRLVLLLVLLCGCTIDQRKKTHPCRRITLYQHGKVVQVWESRFGYNARGSCVGFNTWPDRNWTTVCGTFTVERIPCE